MPDMNAMCSTCGETYGSHNGKNCTAPGYRGMQFVEAIGPVEQYWICYAASSSLAYTLRTLVAHDLDSARAAYERQGLYTFITAEPLAACPMSRPMTSSKIEERIKQLMGVERAVIVDTKLDAIAEGPRKPPRTVIVQDWLKTVNDDELIKEAWAATMAACGGRQS